MTHPHVGAWNFDTRHRELLQKACPQMQISLCFNSKEFLQKLPEAEGVVVWFFKKQWLDLAPDLRLIATPAAGIDWLDVTPRPNLEIWHGGFHGSMMAESVVGAIFYFCKVFNLSARMQSQKKWARVKISEKLRSLYGARVTILGFGKIGRQIGRAVKPFGCSITGIKRNPAEPPDYFSADDSIRTPDHLPEILPQTDHFILVLPGGPQTQGLITRDLLKLLPRHCILYNVGHGAVYSDDDLADALRKGELAGAYLDVFEQEPLGEDSPLWELKNVLIQPHLSAASPQYLELFVKEFVKRLKQNPAP
jgi:phosphoglycerate dehydrogenase-like enzyme